VTNRLVALRAKAWPLPRSLQIVLLSFSVTGITGLSALLTGRWLGAEQRGVITIAQTISSMLALLMAFGLIQSTRMLLSDPAWGLTARRYVTVTRVLVVADLAVTIVVSLTLFPFLLKVFDVSLSACLVVLSTALFRSQLLREALHGLGHHRTAITGDLLAGLIPLLLIGVCHVLVPEALTVPVVLALLATGPLVNYAFLGPAIRKAERASDHVDAACALELGTYGPQGTASCLSDRALLKRIVVFSLPGLVAAGGYLVAGRMDRLVLAAFSTKAAVGVYGMASTLSDLAWTIPVSLSAVIVRSVGQTKSVSGHPGWWRRTMAASVGLCVLMLGAGWFVFEHFLGPDFEGGTAILAVLLLGSLAMASQQVDLAFCNGLGDLKASARSAIVGVCVGLPAYLVLTPLFGVYGCAFGNNLTFVAMAISARRILRARMKELS